MSAEAAGLDDLLLAATKTGQSSLMASILALSISHQIRLVLSSPHG